MTDHVPHDDDYADAALRPQPETPQETGRLVGARINLLDYHVRRGLLFPGMDERNKELHELIDALIAAARAEPDPPLETPAPPAQE